MKMMRLYILSAALSALVLGGCEVEDGPPPDAAGHDALAGDAGDVGAQEAGGDGAVDLPVVDSLLCGGVSCNDKLACTEDLCVASGCMNTIKPGYCVIDKKCYKDGDKEGGPGSCRACDTSKSNSAWTEDVSLCASSGLSCVVTTCSAGLCKTSLNSGYCLVNNVCVKDGQTNPKNACKVCSTYLSTTSYQDDVDGTACGADGLGCTADVCKAGVCTHPLKAGHCLINGSCFYKGELSALQDCRVCEPSTSSTAWSKVADGTSCTDDGVTCTADVCKAGACAHTLAAGFCKISNTCYKSGATSPTSECQGCVPAQSTTAWSKKPNGASCTADALSCTSDTCQSGACTHKLMSGSCLISGTCYVSGAGHPSTPCQGCNPVISQSSWSVLPNGSKCAADTYVCTDDVCQGGSCTHPLKSGYCRISGTCHAAGAKNPAQSCLQCDPKSAVTSWSGVQDGQACASDGLSCTSDTCKSGYCSHQLGNGVCLIGNQCYSAGQTAPGNACMQCLPAASATSWNAQPNGSPCPAGACASGNCCAGCISGNICQPGLAPSACGKGGGPCTQCPTGWTCSGGTCTQQSTVQELNIGPQTGTFSGSTRGYWFQAPTHFTIVGLRVPTDANSGTQHLQIMRFNAQPPTFSASTTSYATLGYWHVGGTGWINVNIPVSTGQYIGVLGVRGSTVNSYGNNNYKTSIKGAPVTLTRLLYQGSIVSSPAGPVSTEPSGSIGRVQMRYK